MVLWEGLFDKYRHLVDAQSSITVDVNLAENTIEVVFVIERSSRWAHLGWDQFDEKLGFLLVQTCLALFAVVIPALVDIEVTEFTGVLSQMIR